MTEAEWISSEDPAAMLRLYTTDEMPWPHGMPAPIVSDRKLRLFSCACRRQVPGLEWGMASDKWGFVEEHPERPIIANNDPSNGAIPAIEHARLFLSEHLSPGSKPPPAAAAASLRDLIGNPFRPVTLPTSCPWVTPAAVSLAQAAYGQRQRPCLQFGYGPGEYHHLCARCQGRGTIDDGTLDNARLAVLSDALEEAGCDNILLLWHLRTGRECVGCGRRRDKEWTCVWCGSAAAPRAAPHYRGCWAVDLVLGRA